jgi:hypothetical protein
MAKNNTSEAVMEQQPVKKAAKGSRGASKKLYYAKGPSQLAKNQAKAATRVARRKAYWASTAGMARKFEKMNTPVKLAKREKSKKARDERRRLARAERATSSKPS